MPRACTFSLSAAGVLKILSKSIDVHGNVDWRRAMLRFEGDAVGVVAANGNRAVWVREGVCTTKGGLSAEGRAEGGWFSASEG